jgi:protein-tyrosine phosphatase/arsenate reductase
MKVSILTITALLFVGPVVGESKEGRVKLYPDIRKNIKTALGEFDEISSQRKEKLEELTAYIQSEIGQGKPISMTFICTHNSRRSHISQIWAQTAAAYYGIPNFYAYSGGTESTAFNPRAVAAIKRAGYKVVKTTEGENPIYHVSYSDDRPPMTNFSKVYNYAPNPTKDFCAVMTCSNAAKACPVVRGASARVAIPFDDPKAFDGTDLEAAKYDERCRQICREMLYVFSQVKK